MCHGEVIAQHQREEVEEEEEEEEEEKGRDVLTLCHHLHQWN